MNTVKVISSFYSQNMSVILREAQQLQAVYKYLSPVGPVPRTYVICEKSYLKISACLFMHMLMDSGKVCLKLSNVL